ncbi:unnamed protein product [Danaus chrysippus]|uniref:Period circadian protein n=1 Tax=Danaus chrysippus TaxID=151541 RepID=A0A8J2MIG9_9NEOP|nr:unnamed protein product [Danaus chrysippus]
MDNLDDSENNAKISDSAYSNSCSNSQSRRSHSSKSTHSGSNSSGSSGYGGKPSTSGYSNNLSQPPEKWIKEKESKKKKPVQVELKPSEEKIEECPQELTPVCEAPKEEAKDVNRTPTPSLVQTEKGPENMEITTLKRTDEKDESVSSNAPMVTSLNLVTGRSNSPSCPESFSCVISMQDGVVMFTTSSIVTALGFPKDMWIGRSFIDFVHPRDRNTFASQITSGLAVPKNVNAPVPGNHVSTMVCRIRRYRGLNLGFGIKEKTVSFMPFLLKFFFKNINDEDGQVIYLVIQATPFFSAFKTSAEIIHNAIPFVIRHSATGSLEYIDHESVPYLGYLPQDIVEKDALQLYHPGDLGYLRQIYETIVKEGGVQRSKPYRMMAQNGDYLKLETEWSSFINPWSKKLEFVIGKHYIVEGPSNPDVFQVPDPEKTLKFTDEEKAKAAALREKITRVMTEVLTKPAEIAKQQMSKRCQDLASFMESLMEETPKIEEELRLEIQDQDHSYYERDSVMLGGISPHHDHSDSKSGTDTPVSYNQLNYNETLQRYFDSHEPYSFEDYYLMDSENKIQMKENEESSVSKCISPMAQASTECDRTSSSECSGVGIGNSCPCDYQPMRLTESLLNKHNAEMERELIKMYRENRSSKGDREKASNETRQKKKQHLARCNAAFQPTSLGLSDPQPHGVKRPSKQAEEASAHKHRCSSPRPIRQAAVPNNQPVAISSVVTNMWPTTAANTMNTCHLQGLGMPPQVSFMTPMAMPGQYPMCYIPVPVQPIQTPSDSFQNTNTNNNYPYQPQPMPYMMYGHAMYGSPFMYPSVDPRSYVPQTTAGHNIPPFGLSSSNYQEACKLTVPLKTSKASRITRENNNQALRRDGVNYSAGTSNRNTEVNNDKDNRKPRATNSSRTVEKTDEESSFSSFYSSFFKTESGSAEDSDAKKSWHKNQKGDDLMSLQSSTEAVTYTPNKGQVQQKKVDPSWVEEVCVTSELIYKYQIRTKSLEEVLSEDKKKLETLEQPLLVSQQLGQLYLDLQLQGVAARLTLEEGITSSSSSGEENSSMSSKKIRRRKREYSKLVMIYEEDAPLPPPENVAGKQRHGATCARVAFRHPRSRLAVEPVKASKQFLEVALEITKMFRLACFLASMSLASSQLTIDGIRCGQLTCTLEEYCSPETNRCAPCSIVCNNTHHNYDSGLCIKECQGYLLDLRYMRRSEYADPPSNITSVQRQAQTALIVSIVALAVLILILIIVCRGKVSWQYIMKKLQPSKNRVKHYPTDLTHHNPHAEMPKPKPELKLEIRNPEPPKRNPQPLNARDLDARTQTDKSQGATTPKTISTAISNRHPAEDTTLDFSYDNMGMNVTPPEQATSHRF